MTKERMGRYGISPWELSLPCWILDIRYRTVDLGCIAV